MVCLVQFEVSYEILSKHEQPNSSGSHMFLKSKLAIYVHEMLMTKHSFKHFEVCLMTSMLAADVEVFIYLVVVLYLLH